MVKIKYLVVLFSLVAIVVVGCIEPSTSVSTESNIAASNDIYDAIYLTVEEETLLTQEEIARENILAVTTFKAFEEALHQHEDINILFFHPDVVDHLDDTWLRDAYQKGLVIVALNTPISHLSEKLNITAEVDDVVLPDEYGRLGLTVLHYLHQPDQSGSRSQHSELYADFATIAQIVRRNFSNIQQPLVCPFLTTSFSHEVAEGSGYETPQEALDNLSSDKKPPGTPAFETTEGDFVTWTYISNGETSGTVTAEFTSWGLWIISGGERCVSEQ